MKRLLLLALPLLLTGCGNNETSTSLPAEEPSVPAWKREFYNYIDQNYQACYVVTIGFEQTEAHTFGYDYYVANVYYNVDPIDSYSSKYLQSSKYLIAVDPKLDKIVQTKAVLP